MYSLEEIKAVCGLGRADQCPSGLQFILEKVAELKPQTYMQIGIGELYDFELFRGLLPVNGIALGIDYKRYDRWNKVYFDKPTTFLFDTASEKEATREAVSGILSSLNRDVDCLFIDGDHSIEMVQNDWDKYSPFVRRGGLIILHDYDPVGYDSGQRDGHGAAALVKELKKKGCEIHSVPTTFIGTAYLYKA